VDFLEVGCGEGFVLSSAVEKGWNVSGVYYQSAPVSAFNPVMVPRVAATKVSWDLFYFRNVLDKYLQFYRAAFQYGVGRNICAVLKKHPLGG
jgi:cyclopropane fatty-acyl-phospholipid synthase-like methyltransferase